MDAASATAERGTRLVLISAALLTLPVSAALAQTAADPLQLPVATTSQVPLTAAYNSRNVPSLAAGDSYTDPTTGVRIYKLTSATFPTSASNWGHDYSEGNDEVSLPYNGQTRSVLVRRNGGAYWLLDFTPGTGVSNPRPLTGNMAPFMDLAFTFSNNPATPYYAYVSRGSTIRRFDLRTMTEAPGNGWPVTGETSAMWLHQSEGDGFFVWMRGATGTTIVGYEPSTGTKKTYTNASLNEPRIDRAGRYVGISMGSNGLNLWDWQANTIAWTTPGNPGMPFAHIASLKRRWLGVDWSMHYPPEFAMFTADQPNTATHIGGPANATLVHGNGNWIQHPADLNDQWAVFCHYGSLRPAESYWLAPGGFVLMTPNGQRRLLGHPYNTTTNYTFFSFAKFSPDGKYVLFTSNMNGSGRSDVFLAELPQIEAGPDTTDPTVAIAAPLAGSTVSGAAVSVAVNAFDDVEVTGVQLLLDGGNLGAEDTSAPFGATWNTSSTPNGGHTLTAVARDAAGNSATSAPVAVTVNNVTDTTPPVISGTGPAEIMSNAATISWTTNEPADSQIDYGTTTAYGTSTPLGSSLVVSHSQGIGGLAPSTLYHYRVRSRDAAGNLTVSGDFAFTTLPSGSTGTLIAHLAFDEGTGTTTADLSGHGHTGTLATGATWPLGTTGPGVALDGVGGYVGISHTPMLNAFPLSAAAWFKTSTTSGVAGVINKYTANSYDGYQVFFENGSLCAWYLRSTSNYVYDGGGCTMRTAGYNDDQWHHVVFVVDAAGGRLYVDGVQRGSQPWTGPAGAPTTTQDLYAGRYPGSPAGSFLAGSVDDVRIYRQALSVAEVRELYTGTAAASFPVTCPASPVSAGASFNATVNGGSSTKDWVASYVPGAPTWLGTYGYVPLPRPATVSMTAPSAGGTYDLRLLANDAYTLIGSCTYQVAAQTPSLSMGGVTVTEGNAGTVHATFDVTLSSAATGTVTVGFATANGTATAGADYVASSGTLSFSAGETVKTVTVLVNGDTTLEGGESFSLDLSAPSGATIAQGRGQGTIVDDDNEVTCPVAPLLPGVTFTTVVSGPGSPADWVATSAPGAPNVAWIGQYEYVPTPRPTPVMMTAPVAGGTYELRLFADDAYTLLAACTYQVAGSLSIGGVTVTEGNVGTNSATFQVTLFPASGGAVSVSFATTNGSATAGEDYVATSGTLMFEPGESVKTVTVLVNGDTTPEASETFFVNLSAASGAVISQGQGQGTIIDDKVACPVSPVSPGATFTTVVTGGSTPANWIASYALGALDTSWIGRYEYVPVPRPASVALTAPVAGGTYELRLFADDVYTRIASCTYQVQGSLSVDDVAVVEGNGGTTTATFQVTLSTVSAGPVSVSFATENATATAGEDYEVTSGTLTFEPGESVKTVTVAVNADTTPEANETFLVNLFAASGAVISRGQGQGTIVDDEVACPLSPVAPGTTFTVVVSGGNTPADWVASYAAGAPDTSWIGEFQYVPLPRPASMTLTAPVADGTYELRVLANDTYTVIGSCAYEVSTVP